MLGSRSIVPQSYEVVVLRAQNLPEGSIHVGLARKVSPWDGLPEEVRKFLRAVRMTVGGSHEAI